MVVEPAATPVITPVVRPAVAMPVLALLQAPPGVASVTVVVAPTHTAEPEGVMATGVGLTVTVLKAEQPAALV